MIGFLALGIEKPYLFTTLNVMGAFLFFLTYQWIFSMAISKTGNGERMNGEWGTGNGESLK